MADADAPSNRPTRIDGPHYGSADGANAAGIPDTLPPHQPGALTRNPATAGTLRWFDSRHLPVDLRDVAQSIEDLALRLARELDQTRAPAELAAGLRKLLEAKDCMVRAAIALRDVR